jgi:hypothetical protein
MFLHKSHNLAERNAQHTRFVLQQIWGSSRNGGEYLVGGSMILYKEGMGLEEEAVREFRFVASTLQYTNSVLMIYVWRWKCIRF